MMATTLSFGVSGDEPARKQIVVGSRKSKLALIQTEWVISHLKRHHPQLEFVIKTFDTVGDAILDKPLSKIGEKSLFTRELEVELNAKNIDIVVHSLKDLPTSLPKHCCLGAITVREDPSDALVLRTGLSLSSQQLESILNEGNIRTIGTSSLRRIAQLRAISSAITIKDVRGNLNTRLAKLDDKPTHGFDCLILASAGLKRLGFESRISLPLQWYHAVSQGALGIECRLNDQFVLHQLLRPIVDMKATLECTAERVFLKCLEGGCSVPIGVRSQWNNNQDILTLHGIVLNLDGSQRVEACQSQQLDEALSENDKSFVLADFAELSIQQLSQRDQIRVINSVRLGRALADIMIAKGVREILASINRDQ